MIDGVLAAGRALAESLMTDRCRIERPAADGAKGPFNPATGRHAPAPRTTVVPATPCRVQRPGLAVANPEAGERRASVETVEVQVPVTLTGADVGDVVVMLASGDPALVGRELVVRSDPAKSHATMRRLRCEEVTS